MMYILNEQHIPVPAASTEEWAEWMEAANRVVCRTTVGGKWLVSTVFLGLDHNFGREGPPILFETMVFYVEGFCQKPCETPEEWAERETEARKTLPEGEAELIDLMARYADWSGAGKGHERYVSLVEKATGMVRDPVEQVEPVVHPQPASGPSEPCDH